MGEGGKSNESNQQNNQLINIEDPEGLPKQPYTDLHQTNCQTLKALLSSGKQIDQLTACPIIGNVLWNPLPISALYSVTVTNFEKNRYMQKSCDMCCQGIWLTVGQLPAA